MTPHHGEVWLVDMGMAAKTRPAVVLIADNLNAPRSLITHFGIAEHAFATTICRTG
jgi:mRNA interferase MazF